MLSVQCNGYTEGGVVGSLPAPIYATAAAGDEVQLHWTTWPDSHVGPMITYMAKAPSDITAWQPGTRFVLTLELFTHLCSYKTFFSAVWFKVAEAGKTSAGLWASTDLLTASGSTYTFTIPKTLKAGQYLVRHEM